MRSNRNTALWTALLGLVTACGPSEDTLPEAESPEQASDTAAGMPGMAGMQMGDTAMLGRMDAHLAMMRGIGGDSMMAMLPAHRQLLANMIAQMNREMRDMQMPADAPWDATIDSLRADLTRMPEMAAAELQVMMPQHHRRVMHLMELHRAMIGAPAR